MLHRVRHEKKRSSGQVYRETRPHERIYPFKGFYRNPRSEADNPQIDCGIQANEHTHPHRVKKKDERITGKGPSFAYPPGETHVFKLKQKRMQLRARPTCQMCHDALL